MKAKELMIGDWVIMRLPHNAYTETAQLDSVDAVLRGNLIAEPIPLTPEILMVNGFQEYPQVYLKHVKKDGTFVRITLLKDKNGNIYIHGVGRIIYLHYVHELQHALRLCGLTELADDFVV